MPGQVMLNNCIIAGLTDGYDVSFGDVHTVCSVLHTVFHAGLPFLAALSLLMSLWPIRRECGAAMVIFVLLYTGNMRD